MIKAISVCCALAIEGKIEPYGLRKQLTRNKKEKKVSASAIDGYINQMCVCLWTYLRERNMYITDKGRHMDCFRTILALPESQVKVDLRIHMCKHTSIKHIYQFLTIRAATSSVQRTAGPHKSS